MGKLKVVMIVKYISKWSPYVQTLVMWLNENRNIDSECFID